MKDKDSNFDANLYSAYLEGKATKEERHAVVCELANNPMLILELNLAASITSSGNNSFI